MAHAAVMYGAGAYYDRGARFPLVLLRGARYAECGNFIIWLPYVDFDGYSVRIPSPRWIPHEVPRLRILFPGKYENSAGYVQRVFFLDFRISRGIADIFYIASKIVGTGRRGDRCLPFWRYARFAGNLESRRNNVAITMRKKRPMVLRERFFISTPPSGGNQNYVAYRINDAANSNSGISKLLHGDRSKGFPEAMVSIDGFHSGVGPFRFSPSGDRVNSKTTAVRARW